MQKKAFFLKKKNKLRNTEKEKKIIDSQGEINRSSSIFLDMFDCYYLEVLYIVRVAKGARFALPFDR